MASYRLMYNSYTHKYQREAEKKKDNHRVIFEMMKNGTMSVAAATDTAVIQRWEEFWLRCIL